jgi:transcriptional regulator with XRE-family HTH domain
LSRGLGHNQGKQKHDEITCCRRSRRFAHAHAHTPAPHAACHEPTKVGDAVGLTFQQVRKYERGSNRIGSSRLCEFAKVLEVPVSYFFDEMPANALSGRPMSGRGRKGFGEDGTPFAQEKDPLIKRETLELVCAYYKIRESLRASASSRGSRRWAPRAMLRCSAAAGSDNYRALLRDSSLVVAKTRCHLVWAFP